MKFEHVQVFNFKGALRGMRNPLASWTRSDSAYGIGEDGEIDEALDNIAAEYCNANGVNVLDDDYDKTFDSMRDWLYDNGVNSRLPYGECCNEYALLGPKDMALATRLIKAGPEHRKFLRQIFISVDVTAPLYWWKEMDTYKLGTTANSTSTMHKLASTPITLDCFETDDMNIQKLALDDGEANIYHELEMNINFLEQLRLKYNETKDKRYWKELVRWLPNGWLQTRTWTANYEVLRSIYHQRKGHKLTEWHQFCEWIALLPYAKQFIID